MRKPHAGMQPSSSTADQFLTRIRTHSLPGLGPDPRADRFSEKALRASVQEFCGKFRCEDPLEETLLCAALLWHDYLDQSHSISQNLASSTGSFLHGIMHRREPDYGNAAYWFRRVGRHDCFAAIAEGVKDFLGRQRAEPLAARWMPSHAWDPFAFIAACEEAASNPPGHPDITALQEVQGIEFEALVRSVFE